MEIVFRSGRYSDLPSDLLAYPVFEGESPRSGALRALDKATRGVVSTVLQSREFKPDLLHTCLVHRPAGLRARRLLLIGAGDRKAFSLSALRNLAATAARTAVASGCQEAVLLRRSRLAPGEAARAAAEGVHIGSYSPDLYRTEERREGGLERFVLFSREKLGSSEVEAGIERGEAVGAAINLVRNLVNEPGNVLTPSVFVERASQAATSSGLELEVLEQADMQKLGMNTLLAVSRGSEEPPKLLILRLPTRHTKRKPRKVSYALVGKGVTFDSGGISLKPAERMEDMKGDMAGGAAVLGAMIALASLKPRQDVIGVIPLVENLPSGKATKPGDVVRSLSGKTVEIINTDAEGRLILADALAYARRLGATHLVDIATLTGACVVALGKVRAGMMGTDQKLMDRLLRTGETTGEKFWQLPLDDDYRRLLRSEIADLRNVGNRWGGAITAAKFLQEFTGKAPWVHLDIAGMELLDDARPYMAKGATGFGVRTLVELML